MPLAFCLERLIAENASAIYRFEQSKALNAYCSDERYASEMLLAPARFALQLLLSPVLIMKAATRQPDVLGSGGTGTAPAGGG